jgi:hypothetical protein
MRKAVGFDKYKKKAGKWCPKVMAVLPPIGYSCNRFFQKISENIDVLLERMPTDVFQCFRPFPSFLNSFSEQFSFELTFEYFSHFFFKLKTPTPAATSMRETWSPWIAIWVVWRAISHEEVE